MEFAAGTLEQTVWTMVQTLNRIWAIDGRPHQLVDYFAPEMVAITPTDGERREGQASCVAGWAQFVRANTIHRWVEKNPYVLILAEGRAAIVAYDFEIDFDALGRTIRMGGRDLMTLECRDGRWWLVADHFSPAPS